MNVQQLTDWQPRFMRMQTEYGNVSYEEWCQLEAERVFKPTGRRYQVQYRMKGREAEVCLAGVVPEEN